MDIDWSLEIRLTVVVVFRQMYGLNGTQFLNQTMNTSYVGSNIGLV